MKIEKINDNQIRCTLTSSDLESRKIRLSELAYGSDKAKQLFSDMMQQARSNFGFESGNSPLMIEAIPISPDSIVLIITKVDDPEELDTRFSRFSSPEPENAGETGRHYAGADDVLDLFRKISEAKSSAEPDKKGHEAASASAVKPAPAEQEITAAVNLIQAYRFSGLNPLVRAARSIGSRWQGVSTLAKDPQSGDYCLLLHADGTSPELFNKICNVLIEYGDSLVMSPGAEAHLAEHGGILLQGNALQELAGF